MELIIKKFEELTLKQLYAVLALRSEVFVVEQSCAYLDPDGRDERAVHLWLEDADGIQAYLRVLPPGELHPDAAAVGRVIAVRRRQGLGTRLLKEGIEAAQRYFDASAVYVEAQTYARGLYEKQGFRPVTEPFLEDGIEHIGMLLKL